MIRIIFKLIRMILSLVGGLLVIGSLTMLLINRHVTNTSDQYIISAEDAADIKDIDAILVLGCQVTNGEPSDMLRDRLMRGIELYEINAAPKLLMSGDHGQKDYNEVGVMRQCAMDSGVPSEDIFMDHAGFSTYESMYRAKEIFGIDKMIIVTQEYHLYRAIYIARQLGIEAYGVACDSNKYVGQEYRDIREVLARFKDCTYCILKPEPTYLGEKIDITGDGNVTNQ